MGSKTFPFYKAHLDTMQCQIAEDDLFPRFLWIKRRLKDQSTIPKHNPLEMLQLGERIGNNFCGENVRKNFAAYPSPSSSKCKHINWPVVPTSNANNGVLRIWKIFLVRASVHQTFFFPSGVCISQLLDFIKQTKGGKEAARRKRWRKVEYLKIPRKGLSS